jgi:hypothetical protein
VWLSGTGGFVDDEATVEVLNEALMLLAAGGTNTLSLHGIGWDPSVEVGATFYLVTEWPVTLFPSNDGDVIPRLPFT